MAYRLNTHQNNLPSTCISGQARWNLTEGSLSFIISTVTICLPILHLMLTFAVPFFLWPLSLKNEFKFLPLRWHIYEHRAAIYLCKLYKHYTLPCKGYATYIVSHKPVYIWYTLCTRMYDPCIFNFKVCTVLKDWTLELWACISLGLLLSAFSMLFYTEKVEALLWADPQFKESYQTCNVVSFFCSISELEKGIEFQSW
jgi:hypothetical protein